RGDEKPHRGPASKRRRTVRLVGRNRIMKASEIASEKRPKRIMTASEIRPKNVRNSSDGASEIERPIPYKEKRTSDAVNRTLVPIFTALSVRTFRTLSASLRKNSRCPAPERYGLKACAPYPQEGASE